MPLVREGGNAGDVFARRARLRNVGQWSDRGLEMPKVFADDATADGCIQATREAMRGVAAMLLEEGKSPPTPAREGARQQQVNVRLTAEERLLFEAAARRKGFAGLSDFFRSAASAEAAR